MTVAEKLGARSIARPAESALSNGLLGQQISDLKKLEQRCFASRKRFRFYRYLASVYELYEELRRTNGIENSVRRIAELSDAGTRKHAHPIRVIIDASSQADQRAQSRWVRSLRFAWRERQHWTDLETFLRKNGGPAGCASQFAALHPRAPGGCVRAGGEDRVPKVPLFVGRDMLRQ